MLERRTRTVRRRRFLIAGIVALICLVFGVAYAVVPVREDVRTIITTTQARLSSPADTPFPSISTAHLSSQQARIINLAHAEYAKHPISYDQAVLTYSQGNKQAWCANFVSWIMLQAGTPYSNPNSGSWRIPGVYTLQEYYQSHNRYEAAGSYRPQPGDVAFYIGKSYFGLSTSGHVALVIKVEGNTMTTIGGNESGRMRIDTQPIETGLNRLVGFGKLTASD
jgi:hypothetical protein